MRKFTSYSKVIKNNTSHTNAFSFCENKNDIISHANAFSFCENKNNIIVSNFSRPAIISLINKHNTISNRIKD